MFRRPVGRCSVKPLIQDFESQSSATFGFFPLAKTASPVDRFQKAGQLALAPSYSLLIASLDLLGGERGTDL